MTILGYSDFLVVAGLRMVCDGEPAAKDEKGNEMSSAAASSMIRGILCVIVMADLLVIRHLLRYFPRSNPSLEARRSRWIVSRSSTSSGISPPPRRESRVFM